MQNRRFLVFCFLLPIYILTSCGDRIEGCLDIEAENFDADADKDCCCDYPDLVLQFNHAFGNQSFRLETPFSYESTTDTFSVNEMRILFSKTHPIRSGLEFEMDKTISVGVDDEMGSEILEFEDNFVVVTPERFTYTINEFNYPGMFEGVALKMGLDEEVRRVIPDSVGIDGHPLESEVDSIWAADIGYFYLYLDVVPDYKLPEVSRKFVIYGSDTHNLTYWHTLTAEMGYDFKIDFKIDYKLLFDGINFEADSENYVTQELFDNLPSSVSILE